MAAVAEEEARKPLSPLRCAERQRRTMTFSEGRREEEKEEKVEAEETAEGETTLDEEEVVVVKEVVVVEEAGEEVEEVEEKEEESVVVEDAAEVEEEQEEEERLSRHAGRHLLLQRAVHAWQRRLPTMRQAGEAVELLQWRLLAAVDWSSGQTPAELRRRLSGVLQRWRDAQPYAAPPTELRLSSVLHSWRDAACGVEYY